MKLKTFVLTMMVLFSISTYGQDIYLSDITSLFMMKNTTEYVNGEFVQNTDWGKGVDVELLLVFDTEKQIIKINNEAESVYHLIESLEVTTDKDEKGNDTKMYTFSAIDEEDIKCEVWIQVWDKFTAIQVYVFYSDISIIYEGFTRDNTKKKDTSPLKV